MASRPFSAIMLHLEKEGIESVNESLISFKEKNVTPIALEPCSTGKAAVLSLILRLPTGGTGNVPSGQTGLAIASALVSLSSLDQSLVRNQDSSATCKQLSVTAKTAETDESSPAVL